MYGFHPGDPNGMFLTLAVQLVVSVTINLVQFALYHLDWYATTGDVNRDTGSLLQDVFDFYFQTTVCADKSVVKDKQCTERRTEILNAFPFVYCFAWGWYAGVVVVPGYTVSSAGGLTGYAGSWDSGIVRANYDFGWMVAVTAILFSFRAAAELVVGKLFGLVEPEPFAVWVPATVRGGFPFTVALIWTFWINYALSPSLTVAMFGSSHVEWGASPPGPH